MSLDDVRETYCGNQALIHVQEEDRRRIANELHDTALQNLACLSHKVELAALYVDEDPTKAKLELAVIRNNIGSIIDEIRNTVFDLRPMAFDDLGLKSALEELVFKLQDKSSVKVDSSIDELILSDNNVLNSIYRVVQEAFSNIAKHSGAKNVLFRTKNLNDKYMIIISDDGIGFSKEDFDKYKEKHFGFLVMKERIQLLGGMFEIQSSNNDGTHINIEVPLQHYI